ncbi:alpha/beta fold hydrolase [Streptomyces flavidovirens]|uniref:alpha/beta fold hydrolase n=1 Tax=Streptomyces flavidovirens TaxID=67298 RepID=UPI00048CC83E
MISVASALASAAHRAFGAAWTAGQAEGAELPAGLPTSFVEARAADLAPVTVAYERQGYGERLLPPRQAARAEAMIPGARLVAMPGCGHVPMAEAPELVARVLRDATRTENRSQPVRSTAGAELTARAWPAASGHPA